MFFKSFIGATCACLAVVSFNVTAIPTEADWKNVGDGLITYDSNTGLEWLDLTVSKDLSFDFVESQLGQSGLFEGWRIAEYREFDELWYSFGGGGIHCCDGIPAPLPGMTPDASISFRELMLNPYCLYNECDDTAINVMLGNYTGSVGTMARITTYWLDYDQYFATFDWGHSRSTALVRIASVPEPSIIVLLASGLMMFGVIRRKRHI